ncbi:hypothetical protein AX15_002995 [Amanita polypyramis BW_CC]|nr:hypothetical protein AX15_002995 [Amanita polypyramis BW_CC]
MSTTPAMYSSVHMRERDKILGEKHKEELCALQRRVDKLRRANDDTLKQLFDAQARAFRLANSLGFKDLAEAQVYIDTADDEIPYKECFDQVSTLKVQLVSATTEADRLREHLEHVNKEKDELTTMLASSREKELDSRTSSESKPNELELQLSALQKHYDELRDSYERATEKYLFDYKTWKNFNAWIFSDDKKDESGGGSSKKRYNPSVMSKKRKVKEMECAIGADGNSSVQKEKGYPPLGDITNPFLMDKEKRAMPNSIKTTPRASRVQNSTTCPLPSAAFTFKLSSSDVGHTLKNLRSSGSPDPTRTETTNMPSCSPSVFLDPPDSTAAARGTVTFKPVPSSISDPKQHLPESVPSCIRLIYKSSPTPSKVATGKTNKDNNLSDNAIPISSDTEDDTQVFSKAGIPLNADAQSSDTEEDTQPPSDHELNVPLPTPKSLPRPSIIKNETAAEDYDCLEPPRKLRRVDAINGVSTPVKFSSRTVLNDPNTPRAQADVKLRPKGKGVDKENKENQAVSTPLNNAKGQSSLRDYSAFKGRGRYAKEVNSLAKTLNGQYEINSTRNHGLGYQYDEVVRQKEDRKEMNGADCECCHDYYNAVGPLPPRMQPPLWRSPPKTEVKKRVTNCAAHKGRASDTDTMTTGGLFNTTNEMDSESQFRMGDGWDDHVENHKKAISRHRHHWARADTPPGYWDIGFPDTQEAANINEKAKEMHRKKQEEVERSVIKGDGKYRRRS